MPIIMTNWPQSSNHRAYATRSFKEIFSSVDEFKDFYYKCGLPTVFKSSDSITTLYYLLYARYANSHIMSDDEGQFKYQMFSLIFQYGGTWEKELEIQKQVRALDIESLRDAGTNLYQHAYNPGTATNGDVEQIIDYTNEATKSSSKKAIAQAYIELDALLKRDVSNYFISRFKDLFNPFAFSQYNTTYTTEAY